MGVELHSTGFSPNRLNMKNYTPPRYWASTALAIALLTLAALPGQAQVKRNQPSPPNSLVRAGQIVLHVPDGMDSTAAQALADSASCKIVMSLPYSPGFYLLQVNSWTRPAGAASLDSVPSDKLLAAIDTLRQTPGVHADPNYVRYAFGSGRARRQTVPKGLPTIPNDPYYPPSIITTSGQKWNYDLVRMPEAWTIQKNVINRPVIVAVEDSGIDPSHPDLKNKLAAGGIDFTPLDSTPPGAPTTVLHDVIGHGTFVAGIIAAETNNALGVASVAGWSRGNVDIRILPVRVLGDDGSGTVATEIVGINYATAQKVDVINFSLGGGGRVQSEEDALIKAYTAGITLVASAGNGAQDPNVGPTAPEYPGAFPEVINVSAVGPTATISLVLAVWQQRCNHRARWG